MISNFSHHFFQIDSKVKISYQINFRREELKNYHHPLIVFNYGLVCSHEHFSKQIPFLSQLGYPILLHDYRGHFKSTGKKNLLDCNFKAFTQDLNQLIKFLTYNQHPISMIGHSMGVNITLEYLKSFPKKLHKIILISGTILPPQDTMFDSEIMEFLFPLIKLMEKKFPKIFDLIWRTNNINPITQWLVLVNGFNYKTVSLNFVADYLKKINTLGPKLFIRLFEEMNSHNIISDLNNINAEALIIGGEKDKIVPNHFQDLIMKKIPHSKFYLLKDGSHVPQVDFPDLVNERIQLFLQEKL